jgi:hypothetical protein
VSVGQDQSFLTGEALFIFEEKTAGFNSGEIRAFPGLVVIS